MTRRIAAKRAQPQGRRALPRPQMARSRDLAVTLANGRLMAAAPGLRAREAVLGGWREARDVLGEGSRARGPGTAIGGAPRVNKCRNVAQQACWGR